MCSKKASERDGTGANFSEPEISKASFRCVKMAFIPAKTLVFFNNEMTELKNSDILSAKNESLKD